MNGHIMMESVTADTHADETAAKERFEDFKQKFGKSYKTKEEEEKRFGIFKQNIKTIDDHNAKYAAGKESYGLGVNQFSDLTVEEANTMNGYISHSI